MTAVKINEAIRLTEQHAIAAKEEIVPLLNAAGRVLSRDLFANVMQPPFDRSPLDGYAVHAKDIQGARKDCPRKLKVVCHLYAGDEAVQELKEGEAARIMTGAMIPQGADCVIRQEDTDEGTETVHIFKALTPWSNYCFKGEEYQKGALLIPKGSLLDAAAISVAAGAGVTKLPVYQKLRAAIITTGDEVVEPGKQLAPGKIYDTNASYLTVRLQQLGIRCTENFAVGDQTEMIAKAIQQAAKNADLIITTGGVSVGEKDLIEKAVLSLGAKLVFHGIDIKPGMPTLFAAWGDKLILGLSGNPFSAAVPFEILIRSLLFASTKCKAFQLMYAEAYASEDYQKKGKTHRFLRAFCSREDGIVQMPQEQSNGQMRSMIGCNCLVDVPDGKVSIKKGESVRILWIS